MKPVICSFYIFLCSFFFIGGVTAQDVRPVHKPRIAIFHFVNGTGEPSYDILQYSLREKLSREIHQYNTVEIIDAGILNERLEKRNLNVHGSIGKPRIIQYISGLINAEMLVVGDFIFTGSDIIVSVQLVDAFQGKVVRNYSVSGNLGYIDTILQNIASDIIADTKTWKGLGGFESEPSMAQHIGKLVAEAEESVKSGSDKEEQKDGINYVKIAFIIKDANLYVLKYSVNEIYSLLTNQQKTSYLKTALGWISFVKGKNSYLHGDPAKAQEYWKTSQALLPGNEKMLLEIADLYSSSQDYSNATDALSSCIRANPENVTAYLKIADLYMEQQNYLLAIFFAGRGLKKDPENRDLYLVMANAYIADGKLEKAIATLQTSMRKFPKDQEMGRLLSFCYHQLGQPERARQEWQSTLEGSR